MSGSNENIPPSAPIGPRRPILITIICVIAFIGCLLAVPRIFSESGREIAPWYPAYMAFSVIVSALCYIGMWMMRRWALFVYTALIVISAGVSAVRGLLNVALIIPIIIVAIGFGYIKRMR